MPNINKIKLSGTSYDIQDANATKTVELTQAQYDALVTGGTVDSNTFYIITDGEMFNPSGKVDTSAFTEFSGAVETELSGKTDESAFTAHTGDSTIHVTTAQTAAWNAKSDFSGSYNDLTDKPTIPTVPTSNTAFTNDAGYITSNDITGKTDTTAFTAHTADTTIHVTAQDKTNWNAKSDFSGSYNDLTDKPTIPTVPTSNTAFTNDAGYITSDAISGKVDTSTFNTYSGSVETALSGKQDTLSAGTNITIVDNVISAESGGGGKAVSGGTNISITTGETADTINCTLPIREGSHSSNKGIIVGDSECSSTGSYSISFGHNADAGGSYSLCMGSNSSCNGQQSIVIGDGSSNNGSDFTYCFGRNLHPNRIHQFLEGANLHNNNEYEVAFGQYNVSSKSNYNYGYSGNTLFSIGNGYDFSSTHNWHNALEIRQNGDIYVPNTDDTSVTGDKAYSLYPMVRLQDTITATAANTTALGGLKLVKLSQSEYDSLATKDNSTLYVIVN